MSLFVHRCTQGPIKMVVLNKCKYLIREEKKGGGRWKERRERGTEEKKEGIKI